MTSLAQIVAAVSRWLDCVAVAFVELSGWLASPRSIRLVELEDGQFVLENRSIVSNATIERLQIVDGQVVTGSNEVAKLLRDSRTELVLKPDRFVFRPLELPARASEFLDGVVRSQIDRLSPWPASEAVFGWTEPEAAGNGRIVVTVAATARAMIAPLVQALAKGGAASILVATIPSGGAAPIRVLEELVRTTFDVRRVRRGLIGLMAVVALAATTVLGTAAYVAADARAQQDELTRRIAERRAAMRMSRESPGDPATAALRALERRKHEAPSSVIVLETLSQVLPDHTYVTELRIEGDKLRVVGLTRDAPSLIRLIEQAPPFGRATFFAPTIRAPNEVGERFHIETRIGSSFVPRS